MNAIIPRNYLLMLWLVRTQALKLPFSYGINAVLSNKICNSNSRSPSLYSASRRLRPTFYISSFFAESTSATRSVGSLSVLLRNLNEDHLSKQTAVASAVRNPVCMSRLFVFCNDPTWSMIPHDLILETSRLMSRWGKSFNLCLAENRATILHT